MKKTLTGLLIVLLCLNSWAQEELSDATIVILPVTTGKYLKNTSVNLLLNQRLITTFSFGEKISYKIYSVGRISMSLELENVGKKTVSIDVERGKTYYYLLGTYNDKKSGFIDLETANTLSSNNKLIRNTLHLEEDIMNPIGKVPMVIEAYKPSKATAFLLNKDGYILTNFHVIEGATSLKIRGIKGDFDTTIEASIIAIDRQNDFALLKGKSKLITFTNPPYTITSSKVAKQLDSTYTLGYSQKEELNVTTSVIDSIRGFENSISEFKVANKGNCGSPLFNAEGNIIGIMNTNVDNQETAGYAIKSDYLKVFLDQIEEVKIDSIVNSLIDLELPEQVEKITDYIYIIETE